MYFFYLLLLLIDVFKFIIVKPKPIAEFEVNTVFGLMSLIVRIKQRDLK